MKRNLALFFIVSFLGMQLYSSAHMADYGLENHEHNGNVCEFYQNSEHIKYGMPNADVEYKSIQYISITSVILSYTFTTPQIYGVASPRAPPTFS